MLSKPWSASIQITSIIEAMFWVRSLNLACIIALAGVIPAAGQSLAPTGTLRAAFLGDNPVLGRVDPKTGAVTGPVADLVKEMAARLKVPYSLIPAAGARDIINRLQAHTADIGFMAFNAGRAADVDFSRPWLLMPNSYLVRADSPLMKVEDADRAGVTITAVKNDTQDVFLTAHLKNNHVNTVPKMPPAEDIESMLMGGKVDAFAANRQRLLEVSERFRGLRVLEGDYYVAGQAIAVAKDDPARVHTLDRLLRKILSTELVKTSIEQAGLHGVDAAKAGGR